MSEHEQPKTVDEIVTDLKETVQNIGSTLEPDADWMPVLLTYDPPAIVGIPMLGDPDLKDLVAKKIIPEVLAKIHPRVAALVTMGWMKRYDPTTLEGRAEQARDEAKFEPGDIANRPGKTECLCIHMLDNTGEERQLMAYVHRYPTSSPLLQWMDDLCASPPKDKSIGRFPDAMRATMEKIWKS